MSVQPRNATVIGGGTMGRGIAHVLAANGHAVRIVDQTLALASRAKEMIGANLAIAAEEGFIAAAQVPDVLDRIEPTDDLAGAVSSASFVVEAVPEDVDLKLGVWRNIDEAADDAAILATNTSSFDVNELAAVVRRGSEHLIGTHWYNPPHIIPCVEVIPAAGTSPETVDATVALLRDLGKEPAVTKSVPGFVGNRIQFVMAAEALRCVEQGIASAEDVDLIVKSSFGFRLGAYGPLAVADLAGLDTYLGVYDYLAARCGDPWYDAPDLLRRLVEQGRTGVKTLGGLYDYSPEEADRLRAERDRLLYRHLRLYQADREDSRVAPHHPEGLA
jgi:3-hydroxybutyryl-CoA dehydrogenase